MIYKILIIIFITIFPASKSLAISIIRDAEVEEFLKELTLPIIQESGLKTENIKIYVVNDNNINAFVAGGQNIFINSGLITKYQDPNILIAVLAHEIGHIAAGHLARKSEEIEQAKNIMIFTYLVGIISAAASGSDAGYAMLMGGNQMAERLFLKYNRSQEEAADILALEYLKNINRNPLGLLKILEFFKAESAGNKIIDEYALTHPISQKRINFIKANLSKFPTSSYNKKLDKETLKMQRIVAKLKGFLNNIKITINETNNKTDFSNLYKRAIALFKSVQIKESFQILDQLLITNPKDPYLLELKGQFLYEIGDLKKSIIYYKKSLDLNKNNPLARIIFSKAILDLDSNDKDLIKIAIKNLNIALLNEKNNQKIYQLLSQSYQKINDNARQNLSLAEYYLLKRDAKNAKKYAKNAKNFFKKVDQLEILRSDDIVEFAKKLEN